MSLDSDLRNIGLAENAKSIQTARRVTSGGRIDPVLVGKTMGHRLLFAFCPLPVGRHSFPKPKRWHKPNLGNGRLPFEGSVRLVASPRHPVSTPVIHF